MSMKFKKSGRKAWDYTRSYNDPESKNHLNPLSYIHYKFA